MVEDRYSFTIRADNLYRNLNNRSISSEYLGISVALFTIELHLRRVRY